MEKLDAAIFKVHEELLFDYYDNILALMFLVAYILRPHKHSILGLYGSYLHNNHFSNIWNLCSPFEYFLFCQNDLFWDLGFSVYS
jgi:hypothetical protein